MAQSSLEKFDWQTLSPAPIIGVDEVGRGCLAGPVYAAAVVLNTQFPFSHYTDSKLLRSDSRKKFCEEILKQSQVGIGFASVDEIDRLNILQATFLAMRRAIAELKCASGHVVVDGSFSIPGLVGFRQTPLIKGDLRCEAVAAASIVAKVTRDQLMCEWEKKFKGYGFKEHKGYGTIEHRKAILELGPSPIHRKTFKGVKEHLSKSGSSLRESSC